MSLLLVSSVAELRAAVAQARRAAHRIGFVPTMGALHAGHAELIRHASRQASTVVVSLFVNPTQFGPNEDYHRYPRTLDADCQLSLDAGASIVFAPSVEEVYPTGSCTFVEVTGLDQHLCGPRRPGHFRGVTTVVLKLFQMVQPDVAVFGAKDAQQARIVRQMIHDLNLPIELVIAETVREADGLALSSRNRYLTAEERSVAPRIYAALRHLQSGVANGDRNATTLRQRLIAELEAIPGARLDYAEIVDDRTLQPVDQLSAPVVVAVALFLGTTRLIDNILIVPDA
jgi:pantoate--beta-alanine ligase